MYYNDLKGVNVVIKPQYSIKFFYQQNAYIAKNMSGLSCLVYN